MRSAWRSTSARASSSVSGVPLAVSMITHADGLRVRAQAAMRIPSLCRPGIEANPLGAHGWRLRRNYIWIFLILYASWGAKIWLFPDPATSVEEFLQRSSVGLISGEIMVALGFAAAMCFAALMKVPAAILNTFIVVFCFLGAFALRNDMADVWLAMLFGVAGFFMRRWDLPIPPLVMGIILGPMAEQYFLTSMVANGNDLTVFVTRPVSAVLLALAAAILVWPAVQRLRRRSA